MELEYLLRHGGPSARGGHVFVYTKEFFAAEYIQAIHCRVMGCLVVVGWVHCKVFRHAATAGRVME